MLKQSFFLLLVLLAPVACRTEPVPSASDLGDPGRPERDAATIFDAAVPADAAIAPACAELAEGPCRAAAGCVADYCEECSCVPTFVGCRAPTSAKTSCPLLACWQPQCCREQQDCDPNGLVCFNPDAVNSGIRNDPHCNSDTQCVVGTRCVDGRCQAGVCSVQCPSGLVCDQAPGSSIVCVHATCAIDADCEHGFCVGGECYRSLGTCQSPAPP